MRFKGCLLDNTMEKKENPIRKKKLLEIFKAREGKKKKGKLSQAKMDFSDLSDTGFLTFILESNRQTKQGIVYCFGEECMV